MPNRIVRCGSAKLEFIARGKALRWSCSVRIDAIFLWMPEEQRTIMAGGNGSGFSPPYRLAGSNNYLACVRKRFRAAACRLCLSRIIAADLQAAQDAGLTTACHIQGGIDAWKKDGGPLGH